MNSIEQRFFEAFKKVCKSSYLAQSNKHAIKVDMKILSEPIDEELYGIAENNSEELRYNVKINTYCENIKQYESTDLLMFISQHKVNEGYVIDFLLTMDYLGIALAIEIDGHEWHEKTKEQASRDKERERYLLRNGYFIMRFSGSDVYTKAEECAKETLDTFISVYHNIMSLTPELYYKNLVKEIRK